MITQYISIALFLYTLVIIIFCGSDPMDDITAGPCKDNGRKYP